MKRTREEAEATKEALVAAALTVFSRQGYGGSRLEDVAAEAGVTRGAIYHHFTSKADLYAALVADASERLQPVIEEALEGGPTPLAAIRRYCLDVLLLAVILALYGFSDQPTTLLNQAAAQLARPGSGAVG